MKFDRTAPGGGLEVYCTLQTGKALLEWKFYCVEDCGDTAVQYAVRLLVYDREETVVLEGWQRLGEEELLKTVLLRPRLWNSTKDPCRYRAEAFLLKMENEKPNGPRKEDRQYQALDQIAVKFPVRSFREIPGKGWYLNEEPFCRKAVAYFPMEQTPEEETLRRELSLFLEAGANTLCIKEPHSQPPFFYEICEKLGFLVWAEGMKEAADSRHFQQGGIPTSLFYRYKALWCEEPFVYIDRESITREKNGNYSVTVYSSRKKVALYADGVLFEFQSGETAFVFHEIPFHGLFLCLTAETGECSMSLSIHKTFTKASLFHDNYPLE